MRTYTLNQVNNFVLKKQHLADDFDTKDIVQITSDIFGLHATGATNPFLSLLARKKDFTKEELINELAVKKTLAKIRCVRKTVYIIPKDLIPIVFAATGKMVGMISERHYKYLGITQSEYEEISKRIMHIIQSHGMTTKEIKQELNTSLNVSPIVNLMCDLGLLVRGVPKSGWKSNNHTYYRFDEYFPDVNLNLYEEQKAKNLVVEKYLSAFAPVSFNDIMWWTGFTKGEIKKSIDDLNDKVSQISISDLKDEFFILSSDKTYLLSTDKTTKLVINLLPTLDPYIMGYKDRERYLNNKYYNMIFDRSGNASSSIFLNGQIIGIWDYVEPNMKIYLFNKVKEQVLKEIHQKAICIGRFITGKDTKIIQCKSMIPLTERTAGSVMSPLKDQV